MSLINQMLADLERRSGEARPAALEPEIRAVPRPRRPWLRLGVLLAAGAMGGSAMTIYWTRQAPGPAAESATRPSQTSMAAVQVEGASGLFSEPATAAPTPGAEASGEGTQEVKPQTDGRPAEASVLPEQATTPAAAPQPKQEARPGTEPSEASSSPAAPRESAQPPRSLPPAAALPTGDDAAPGGGSSPSAPAPEKTGDEPPPRLSHSIDKKIRPPTPEEQAEDEFRRGLAALQRHRDREAIDAFRAALARNPRHETARQSLVALLLEGNRLAEAESALAEGLALNPGQVGFATALARIQVERGATAAALDTLAAAAPYGEGSAQFEAFFAALLHRAGRHREAAEHYARALQIVPGTGVWLLGLGLALQADGRPAEARAAFEQARASRQLNPELTAFVEQQLSQLPAN